MGRKIVAKNKKAFHDYHIDDIYDAGIVLMGSEIKSIRDNRVNLREGFVQDRDGELWLLGVHISPYEQASIFGHSDPVRPRKLLLHKREISKIISQLQGKGYTVVPIQLYLERGLAKVEIGLAKGKKLYDKRQTIAKRDVQRDIQRALKNR
jgi:SsrA-binding protein